MVPFLCGVLLVCYVCLRLCVVVVHGGFKRFAEFIFFLFFSDDCPAVFSSWAVFCCGRRCVFGCLEYGFCFFSAFQALVVGLVCLFVCAVARLISLLGVCMFCFFFGIFVCCCRLHSGAVGVFLVGASVDRGSCHGELTAYGHFCYVCYFFSGFLCFFLAGTGAFGCSGTASGGMFLCAYIVLLGFSCTVLSVPGRLRCLHIYCAYARSAFFVSCVLVHPCSVRRTRCMLSGFFLVPRIGYSVWCFS